VRKNAEKVLVAFEKGESCNGKTIQTDGESLFSYNMLIGRHSEGLVSLLDYGNAPSATTRSHVRAAETYFRGRIGERF
jgi:hypothetical protein